MLLLQFAMQNRCLRRALRDLKNRWIPPAGKAGGHCKTKPDGRTLDLLEFCLSVHKLGALRWNKLTFV